MKYYIYIKKKNINYINKRKINIIIFWDNKIKNENYNIL